MASLLCFTRSYVDPYVTILRFKYTFFISELYLTKKLRRFLNFIQKSIAKIEILLDSPLEGKLALFVRDMDVASLHVNCKILQPDLRPPITCVRLIASLRVLDLGLSSKHWSTFSSESTVLTVLLQPVSFVYTMKDTCLMELVLSTVMKVWIHGHPLLCTISICGSVYKMNMTQLIIGIVIHCSLYLKQITVSVLIWL